MSRRLKCGKSSFVSVRKHIESLESVSGPVLNSLNRLPFCVPCAVWGTRMWTRENSGRYDRSGPRYESDLTDEEWVEIAPLIPAAKSGGNKRTVNLREVVKGLMYILSTGCQRRAIPKGLAARSTVYDYFDRRSWDGTLERIHHALSVKCREQASREASPTAAIIDAQSVKSAEKGCAHIDPHGYDAGKKIKGKKRHILADTQGLMMRAIVHRQISRTATAEHGCWARCLAFTPSC
jgi:transposase